jgi:RimJ/RimL family protein N-acetyltransferase
MNVPINLNLPAAILARAKELPLKPEAVTLTGCFVRLLPLAIERDAAVLHRVSNGEPITLGERAIGAYDADERVWRYMSAGPFATVAGMAAYLRGQIEAPDVLPFCVHDIPTGSPVGVACYLANQPQHLKIELGSIWYSPIAQGTPANTEATYLMLKHAFDLGYRRLEWKCNALNERSRRAALRLGFQFEGIQEYHYIVKGRNRDTAWFRLLDREWPAVRAQLESRLYA